MDITKEGPAMKQNLARKYFIIGIFLLPLVWVANFVWFFEEAFCKPASSAQKQIRKYVVLSGVGASIWIVIIVAWELVFQSYRSQGLEWTDYLSFTFPSGRV